MASNSKDGSNSGLFFIQDDGDIFLSMKFVSRIPVDPPISQRLFSEPLSFENSASILLSNGGKLFLSLNYLNRLLSSSNNRPVFRVVLAIQRSDNHDQCLTLELQDASNCAVSLLDSKSVKNHHLQNIAERQDANSVEYGQVANGPAEQQDRVVEGEVSSQGEQEQEDGNQGQDDDTQHTNSLERAEHQQIEDTASLRESSTQRNSDQQQVGSQRSNMLPAIQSPDTNQTSLHRKVQNAETYGIPPKQKAIAGDPMSSQVQRNTSDNDKMGNASHAGVQIVRSLEHQPGHHLQRVDLWKKLRDIEMTDANVLQDFLNERLPIGLFAITGTFDYVPFATLKDGREFSVRVSQNAISLWRDLGICTDVNFDYMCRRELVPKIRKLHAKFKEFRRTVNDYNHNLTPSSDSDSINPERASVQNRKQAKNPEDIDWVLEHMERRPVETLERWKGDIERFARHYRNLFELGDLKQKQKFDDACDVRQQAREISERIGFWRTLGRAPEKNEGFSRLVRKVNVSKDIPMALEYPLPKYVFTVGRLYLKGLDVLPPSRLDVVVLIEATSPRKAIWGFSYMGGVEKRCALELLATDISEFCTGPSADGGKSNPTGRHGAQFDEWKTFPRVRQKLWNYPDSRVEFSFGGVSFEPSFATELVEAIQQGWGTSVQVRSTQKREGDESSEPRARKRPRLRIKLVRTKNGIPIMEDDEKEETGNAKNGGQEAGSMTVDKMV